LLAEKLGKNYNVVIGYVQNRQQPRLEFLFEIGGLKFLMQQVGFNA
jgi:putative transcriptional regulator